VFELADTRVELLGERQVVVVEPLGELGLGSADFAMTAAGTRTLKLLCEPTVWTSFIAGGAAAPARCQRSDPDCGLQHQNSVRTPNRMVRPQ
jgi:hypothetical protein